MSVNQHGPCTGNAASCTTSGTVEVVGTRVVVGVAASGRHNRLPGNSGVVALAPLAAYRAAVLTPVFWAIFTQKSPATTS